MKLPISAIFYALSHHLWWNKTHAKAQWQWLLTQDNMIMASVWIQQDCEKCSWARWGCGAHPATPRPRLCWSSQPPGLFSLSCVTVSQEAEKFGIGPVKCFWPPACCSHSEASLHLLSFALFFSWHTNDWERLNLNILWDYFAPSVRSALMLRYQK